MEAVAPAEAELTRALYERYAHQIFRYCLHQLGSREEAEDAVQSTFLNAFRGIKRGIVPELESAWLFKIAHNVCLSRRRSSWRRGRVESPADFELVEELMPAPSRGSEELIGLQDALEEMPENQRRAILLREWQGLSYREIAAELELSQAAVETLIFRARRALASGLESPPERRRVARAVDWGTLVGALKSLVVGGSAAAKVAATVAVVSATAVVAAEPIHRQAQHHATPAPVTPTLRQHRPLAPAVAVEPASSQVAAVLRRPAAPAVDRRPPGTKGSSAKTVGNPTGPLDAAAPAEASPAQQPVEEARAWERSRPASDKRAAKAGTQGAKEPKKTVRAERRSSKGRAQAPTSGHARPVSPATGTSPSGKQKDHGNWGREQQAPVTAPVAAPPVEAPPVEAPVPTDEAHPLVPGAKPKADK